MRILVYGAGVQGSLYAARLHEHGHDVSLLARGQRLVDLRAHGVILRDVATGRRTTTPVPVVEGLDPADVYDLAIVPVRREQVGAILPALAAGRIPTILFMHNHAGGSDDLVAAVGRGRVLLGFPGASGRREGPAIDYILIPQQPTTLGELDGRATPRATAIADALRGAGFRVAISRDMDAWLKAHAVLVTAVSGALYLADGDNERLARTPATVALFASGVREGFRALRALGLPPPPRSLRAIFGWLPNRITVAYWRRLFGSPQGEAYFAWHARSAWEEGKALAGEVRALVRSSGRATPALDQLCAAIDAYAAARALSASRE